MRDPLVVATDGSSLGAPVHERGYAVVLPDGRGHYGPVPNDRFGLCDTELYAIYHALTVTTGPLHVVTDCSHATFLADGTRPRAAHEHAVVDAIAALSRHRTVTYEIRLRDTGPPQHALAHYLAFRGRRGDTGRGVVVPEAVAILTAPDPYEHAATLVRRTLFPAAYA